MANTCVLARPSIEDFLYREVALLDDRQFEEWLDLFADPGVYRVPIGGGADDVHLIFDDLAGLRVRVKRLMSGRAYVQEPPSITCRTVTNVQITGETHDAVDVRCGYSVDEVRPNHDMRSYKGSAVYRLVRVTDDIRIQQKIVNLINAAEYVSTLGIIL